MDNQSVDTKAGFFTMTLRHSSRSSLLASNNERAFVVSQLQDLLEMRSLLEDSQAHHRLASHIDLLAYSVLPQSIKLLVFAISEVSVLNLAQIILRRLNSYKGEWQQYGYSDTSESSQITIRQVSGPHEALHTTIHMHLRHKNWEFDRYSSIGFYLHDRRGDWVRIWRLTHLYNTNTNVYRDLINDVVERCQVASGAMMLAGPSATLAHA